MIEGKATWDSKINILNFPEAHSEILFWRDNFDALNSKAIICENSPLITVKMFSDASDVGIGVTTENRQYVCHKNFEPQERGKNSTWRELEAVLFGLQSLCKVLENKQIVWHVDNYATTLIIRSGSNKSELQEKALKIFEICKKFSVKLKTIWIPRDENQISDTISRYVDSDDWRTTDELFTYLQQVWGPMTCDRFADHANAKLEIFNSRFFCPGTSGVDAFAQNWRDHVNYFVPPVKLISQCIRKIEAGGVQEVLVVPFFPKGNN